MSEPHIKDIIIEFDGDDLTKYGLFPLLAWFLMDYFPLPNYSKDLTGKEETQSQEPNQEKKIKI